MREGIPSRMSRSWEKEEEFRIISHSNSEFSKIALEISQHIDLFGGKPFSLVKAWISKLNDTDNWCVGHSYCKEYSDAWRGERNAQARALLRCLRDGQLRPPFDAAPPDQPLIPPSYLSSTRCRHKSFHDSLNPRSISFNCAGGKMTPNLAVDNKYAQCSEKPKSTTAKKVVPRYFPVTSPDANDEDLADAASAHKAYLDYQFNNAAAYFPRAVSHASIGSKQTTLPHSSVATPRTPGDRLSEYIRRASDEAAKARAAIDQTITKRMMAGGAHLGPVA